MAVEVVAAVIERPDGSFLLAQRPAGKVYAGWWEFPGGKIEPGEPAQRALARELHEELGIEVRRAYPWVTRVHIYEHATVLLHFFRVVEWTGEPAAREGQALVWQRLDAPIAEPMLPANGPVLALPLEYAITDAQTLGAAEQLARVEKRMQDGLRLIQVRDKGHWERARLIYVITRMAEQYGAKVLVNGGPAGANTHGIHYSAEQLMTLRARPQGGPERGPNRILMAASCHTAQELGHAMAIGLDFVVLGPVKATPSHPGTPVLGWDEFRRIAEGASIPVYAIGGLRRKDLADARGAGAHGLAMIRGSWE